MFMKWITKRGRVSNEVVNEDGTNTCKFATNKWSRQDNLRKSIMIAFAKHSNTSTFRIVSVAAPVSKKPTTAERITVIEAELRELRDQPTTINNNNVIILNFGQEDMSYVDPPIRYLENAFEGLHELLKDVYFNDDKPQNHTIRLNFASRTAEISANGGWKKIAMPDATKKMIDNMLSAYYGERHKDSLCTPGEGRTAPIAANIHNQLTESE